MPEITVLSKVHPATGQSSEFSDTPRHILWRGEAANFPEAKEKASAACMGRVKQTDMKAYFSTDKEVVWG